MKKIVFAAIAASTLAACSPGKFDGPSNATHKDFMAARYACLQETQHPVSSGYFGSYGGGFNSTVAPSCGAFTTCMALKGFTVNKKGSFQAPSETRINCVN